MNPIRNDASDQVDDIPTLKPDADDREAFNRPSRSTQKKPRSSVTTGPLWALTAALALALGALAWWSHQQLSLMERQLVATQESFVRVSEEAAGRLQDISGKVFATESNELSEREAFRLELKQLKEHMQAHDQWRQDASGHVGEQGQRLQQITQSLKTLQDQALTWQTTAEQTAKTLDDEVKALADRDQRIDALQQEVAQLRVALEQSQNALETAQTELKQELAALKKNDQTLAVKSLQGDLLVLRSELENRPSANSATTTDFDAFRAQTNRTISTLQAQIKSLQGQIRPR